NHRHISGMSLAGKGKGTVEGDRNAVYLLKNPLFPEFPDPTLGRTPRPKGMGAGGAHPDLEHIKHTDAFHGNAFMPKDNKQFPIIGNNIGLPSWIIGDPRADSLSDSWPWHDH